MTKQVVSPPPAGAEQPAVGSFYVVCGGSLLNDTPHRGSDHAPVFRQEEC